MKGFILSLRSEFYKSRKTMGFWGAVILPLLIVGLIFLAFLLSPGHDPSKVPGMFLWMLYILPIQLMMNFLLPMYVIFASYSVSSIEHKADTWKTLFTLPISKWSVYAAKYFYNVFLVLLCLLLFYLFIIGGGNLLGLLNHDLHFYDYHVEGYLAQVYIKLFFASWGIISLQFLMSLLWADFLKPMGIGFVCTIAGVIIASANWEYTYLFPYAHPMLALRAMMPKHMGKIGAAPEFTVDIMTKDVYVGLCVAVVVFIAGFFIVQKKSVK